MDLLLRLWNGLVTNLDLVVAAFALFLVVHLARRWAAGRGWPGRLEGMDTWVIVGVVVGARAGTVLPEAPLYAAYPVDLVRVNQGMSFYGALGGGAIALALYARAHLRAVPTLFDAFAVFLPLGIALYRVGCLAYGFCGGRPAPLPLGLPLPGHVGTRYPSDLLEGLLALGLFLVLLKLAQRPLPVGVSTGAFLLAYPALRSAVDLTRFPTGPWPWADLVVSLGVALLGLALLLVLWLRRPTETLTRTGRDETARPLREE